MAQSSVETKPPRSFGLLVGSVFAIIGLWPAVVYDQDTRLWSLSLGGLLLIPAILAPRTLRPVYRLWMAAGEVLGWINTRIILGVVFYGLLTPVGLTMRLLRKDPIQRQFDPLAETYRVVKQPRPASHMTHQF